MVKNSFSGDGVLQVSSTLGPTQRRSSVAPTWNFSKSVTKTAGITKMSKVGGGYLLTEVSPQRQKHVAPKLTIETAAQIGRLAVKVTGSTSTNVQRLAARKAGRRRTAAKLLKELEAALAPSRLGSVSVSRDTVVDYSRRLGDFWAYANTEDLATGAMEAAEVLDPALAGYMDHLWQEGEDHNEGEKMLAAVEFLDPGFGKNGSKRLPISRQALKGWRKKTPQCPVDPMPETGAAASVEWLVENRSTVRHAAEIGLWILFQLTSYCRPSESYIKLKYVLEPAENAGPLSFPAVLVRLFEEELPSKNGSFKHGIVMDDPSLLWVG